MRAAKTIASGFSLLVLMLVLATTASAAKPVKPVIRSATVEGKVITIKGSVKLPARSAFKTRKVTIGLTLTDSTGSVLKPKRAKLKTSSKDQYVRNYGFRVEMRVAGPVKIRAGVYDGPKLFGKLSTPRVVEIARDQAATGNTPAPGGDTNPPPPLDTDADGVVDSSDNCPVNANADQADNDSDGKGDACDPCQNIANPGAANCPATIYQVKNGTIAIGEAVRISELVVTAVSGTDAWAQLPTTAFSYSGSDNSGIRLIFGSAPTVDVGDEITVDGVVGAPGDARTLSVTAAEVVGTGRPAPAPVVLTSTTFLTKVIVVDATLVKIDNIFSGSTYNTTGWLLNDALGSFAVLNTIWSALPPVNAPYSSVTGIAGYDGTHPLLMPRDANDIGPYICLASLTTTLGC